MSDKPAIRPLLVECPEADLPDLRKRLNATRLPEKEPVADKSQGVPLANVFETMQVYLGSLYVNDFNRFGRTYQVRAQADATFRERPEDVTRLKTRNSRGEMVPLGALVKVTETYGRTA